MGEEIMDRTTKWGEGLFPRDYVQGHLYWTMAKTLANMNDFAGAVQYAERMTALENQRYFNRKAEEEGMEEHLNDWQRRLEE